ncbi:endonuclease [Micromonospora globispora]|uniref:Endonuclease n=2 Tax=Micromonospora globispora TaxID=1450148 RepID=A0A317JU81_9ACTN|nr:endonuclease [Micromonospora globispora]
MDLNGPGGLHVLAAALSTDGGVVLDDDVLRGHLAAAQPDDALRKDLHLRLATWDAEEKPSWAGGTPPRTQERRKRIIDLLRVDEKTASLFAELFPVASSDLMVIDKEWEPWYTEELRQERNFYWAAYRRHLAEERGFGAEAIARLDAATTSVVERLADPSRFERHQAKGLVVGYVQSGKTANFTGVIAKAIDAGYRLIVVLTGTTDLLRTQTQRRLDMELAGRENLLRGISEDDTESFDYHDDPDWIDGNFLQHGCRPSDVGRPDIIRLTTRRFDYRSLQQGISALDFERRDRARAFFDPINLLQSDARLLVVKKNGLVLRKLVKDLGKITARLGEIPALIIDDESDQASPNTSNPKKWAEDQIERTAINKVIAELLVLLPRAQYVGYTATPFANVFIDPSDAENIFPKDFLISLERPHEYMGAEDFHDIDAFFGEEGPTFANSKEKAHVRPLNQDDADEDRRLLEALDTFVLTGAVKLYREDQGLPPYTHHTMLVHEAMKTVKHREQASVLRDLWRKSGYYSPASGSRLRDLYEKDVLPVSAAVAPQLPTPATFDELAPYVAKSVRRIGHSGDPVIVVNSEKDTEKEEIDFDKRSVWRVLVGGNKLARGFTVEGLTVSYYRRLTKQQDTLMQMGRWFGFRRNYRDLVRLYITPILHEAFEASCLDEEHFRAELRRYSEPVEGGRQITPAQIPPLVAQHLYWLKPTAANKMYNAQLTERRSPGIPVEPRCFPSSIQATRQNTEAFLPLVEAASKRVSLYGESKNWKYETLIGSVAHPILLSVLESISFAVPDFLRPDLRWLASLRGEDVTKWVVIFPQQASNSSERVILGHGPMSVFVRKRLRDDYFSVISEERHRHPIQAIKRGFGTIGDPFANDLVRPRTGAVLVYPVVPRKADGSALLPGESGDEVDPGKVTMAFHLVAPSTATGRDSKLVTFTTRDRSRQNDPIVDKF